MLSTTEPVSCGRRGVLFPIVTCGALQVYYEVSIDFVGIAKASKATQYMPQPAEIAIGWAAAPYALRRGVCSMCVHVEKVPCDRLHASGTLRLRWLARRSFRWLCTATVM